MVDAGRAGRLRAAGYILGTPLPAGPAQELKQFRRVATRYDKTAASFLAFATLAAVVVLLR